MDDQRLHDELARRGDSVHVDADWSRRQLLPSVRHAIDTRPERVSPSSRWSAFAGIASVAAILLVLVVVAPRLAQGPAASDVPTASSTGPVASGAVDVELSVVPAHDFISRVSEGEFRGETVLVDGWINVRGAEAGCQPGDECRIGALSASEGEPTLVLFARWVRSVEGVGYDSRFDPALNAWFALPDPSDATLVVSIDHAGRAEYLGAVEATSVVAIKPAALNAVDPHQVQLDGAYVVRGWLANIDQRAEIGCRPAGPSNEWPYARCRAGMDVIMDDDPNALPSIAGSGLEVQRTASESFAAGTTRLGSYVVMPRLYDLGCQADAPCWFWDVIARVSESPKAEPTVPPPASPTAAPIGIIDCTGTIPSVRLTDYIGEVVSCEASGTVAFSTSEVIVTNPDGDLAVVEIAWAGNRCADSTDIQFAATLEEYRVIVNEIENSNRLCDALPEGKSVRLHLTRTVAADDVRVELRETWTPARPSGSDEIVCGPMTTSPGEVRRWHPVVSDPTGVINRCDATTSMATDPVPMSVSNPAGDRRILEVTWTEACANYATLAFTVGTGGYELRAIDTGPIDVLCDGPVLHHVVTLHLRTDIDATEVVAFVTRPEPVSQPTVPPPSPPVTPTLFECAGPPVAPPATPLPGPMPVVIDRTGLVIGCLQTDSAEPLIGAISVSNPFESNAIEIVWAAGVCDNAIQFTLTTHSDGIDVLGARPATCDLSGHGLPVYITFSRDVPAESVHAALVDGRVVAPTSAGEFTLTITAAEAEYNAGDAIDIEAQLLYDGAEPTVALSGAGLLNGFDIYQLDGLHAALEPEVPAMCQRLQMVDGEPFSQRFGKSGAISDDPPFNREWFDDPELRLPSGTWLITVNSDFMIGPDCQGQRVGLEASVVVRVH